MNPVRRLFGRAILWLAGVLLTLQTGVIIMDAVAETYFLDELVSWGINAAMTWIVFRLRRGGKAIMDENTRVKTENEALRRSEAHDLVKSMRAS